jgi:hypothetical protein
MDSDIVLLNKSFDGDDQVIISDQIHEKWKREARLYSEPRVEAGLPPEF